MTIKITGARQNNLKNISVIIPRNKFIVITGVSGSGKSSLAYDVIFNEAQREFMESFSTYSQGSIGKFTPAIVDRIEGLSPCLVINQKPLVSNPRSTVGTVTEAYTYLRLIYSCLGSPSLNASDFSFNTPIGACQTCKGLGIELIPDITKLIDWEKSLSEGAIRHHNWAVGTRMWNIINATGEFDMTKILKNYSQDELESLLFSEPKIFENKSPGYKQTFTFEGVISRLVKSQKDSEEISNESRSLKFFSTGVCRECQGARISENARKVVVNGKTIVDLINMEVKDLLPYISLMEGKTVEVILPHLVRILENMVALDLGYLSLGRSVTTLSGGESQRLKFARQLGSKLTEMLYILDEPTSGLHARDVEKLIGVIKQLSKKPNTVIVVEHDKHIILNADHIIDLGPGAGSKGGNIIAQGSVNDIIRCKTLTCQYLSGDKEIASRKMHRNPRGFLKIEGASLHNLKNIDVDIPLNVLSVISGVSGAGKSSLVDVLLKSHPEIVVVDQSPIGSSSKSITATYAKIYDSIRSEFAKATGQNKALFTFNGAGACENCGGLGYKVTDMHFLGDVSQLCTECEGKRFKKHILSIRYKGKNISDILSMTVTDARKFFNSPSIGKSLGIIEDVGLGYLQLGQPINTLSGGEAQRLKLASRLNLRGNIYVLDEPTRGLHLADIDVLLNVFNQMVNSGNTLILVEHNLEIIKNADWIIDLGPDGGERGGYVVAQGTPEQIAQTKTHTGYYLSKNFSPS